MGTSYDSEPVDRLPFGTAEKSARYATERYVGATGLNWWRADPTLQFVMRRHLTDDEIGWAEPHLDRIGALMGGPVSERAEITDKNPPRLERYDRWGHDISEVVLPASFLETRRGCADRRIRESSDPQRRHQPWRSADHARCGAELPAEPSRDRHDLRARDRRRHGREPGSLLRPS